MSRQLRFDLNQPPVFRREAFVVSPANAAAVGALDIWRMWPSGVAALIGPEGSGKSHLATTWAAETGAALLDRPAEDLAFHRGKTVLIEDADVWPDAEGLFHLINMAGEGGALLLTSRIPPAAWPTSLPDLRSRLNAMQVIELSPPDDVALAGVLRNLLRQRNIVPAADLIPYLLTRMERSITAARETVALLDDAAASRGREVNRALAIQALEVDSVINDLLG